MAVQLKPQDVYLLGKADVETGTIDLKDRMIVKDPESVPRLVKASLIATNGKLTSLGLKQAEKVRERSEMLKKGLPFEKRAKADPKALFALKHTWLTGTYQKKKYYTNGQIAMVGLPDKAMEAREAASDARKDIAESIKSGLAGTKWAEVKPSTWVVPELGGIEAIWMVNEKKGTMVSIQPSYLDYILYRYSTASFFADTVKGLRPLQVRVKNQGWSGVVGLVMPIQDPDGVLETPKEG